MLYYIPGNKALPTTFQGQGIEANIKIKPSPNHINAFLCLAK